MRSSRWLVCLSTITLIFAGLASVSSGFVAPRHPQAVPQIALTPHKASPSRAQFEAVARIRERLRGSLTLRWDEQTGTPRLVRARLCSGQRRDEVATARRALESLWPLFDFRKGEDSLVLGQKLRSPGGFSHLLFDQYYRGVPVWRAQVRVHIDGLGVVREVNGRFFKGINCPTKPLLTAQDAREVFASFLMIDQQAKVSPSARLVIAPTRSFRLCFEVSARLREPLGSWVMLVDATNGDVLYLANEMRFGRVQGDLYEVNPEKTPLATLPIRDEYIRQDRETYTSGPDGYFDAEGEVTARLSGPYCRAVNDDVDNAYYEGDADFVWRYEPDNTHFDEVSAFYYVNTIHAWFKEQIGFDGADRQVRVTVHYMTDLDNAAYDPINDEIVVGDGTVRDPAHEADVVMHEYGHAVVHTLASMTGSEGSAMDEGYADYFTCSFHDDPLVGEWWMPPYLRDLDNDMIYPFDISGEPHHDGQIWSGALWEIRRTCGAEVADKLALGALYYLPISPTFLDGKDALLDADEELFASQHRQTIVEVFSRRGVSNLYLAAWTVSEVSGNGNGLPEPGETLQASLVFRNTTTAEMPQAYVALSSESEYVNVKTAYSTLPPIPKLGKAAADPALQFEILPSCPSAATIDFTVKLAFQPDKLSYCVPISLSLAGAAQVSVSDHLIFDFIGNQDSQPNPGEMLVFGLTLANQGNATASNVKLRAFVDSPYVNSQEAYSMLYKNGASFGDIGPGQSSEAASEQQAIIQLLDSLTPDGYEYEVQYDIMTEGGGRWTGSFNVTVTGTDETAPWVAYASSYPRLADPGDIVSFFTFVIEPGTIRQVSGTLHDRQGRPAGSVYFFPSYMQGFYMGFTTMPADEDLYLDITATDGLGNEGTARNTCAVGPSRFESRSNILYVPDDLADRSQTRAATLDALASLGLSADIWEPEVRGVPDEETLAKYLDGAVIWEAKTDPYFMPHAPYLVYEPEQLSEFLATGGTVLLMGQKIGTLMKLYHRQGDIISTRFLCEVEGSKQEEQIVILGEAGDPIGDGLSLNLWGSDFGQQVEPDVLHPLEGADPVFYYLDNYEEKAGVRVQTESYRAAYLAFGLCDIDGAANRETVLSRTLSWLGIPAEQPRGVPILAAGFDETNLTSQGGLLRVIAYTNPSYTIERIDLCYDGSPLGITLHETSPNLYTTEVPIGQVLPGTYLLELVATLPNDEQVFAWPFLPVGSKEDWQSRPGLASGHQQNVLSPDGPTITVAGFCSTQLWAGAEGLLNIVAQVTDPDGLDDIVSVSAAIYLSEGGEPLRFDLADDGQSGDFGANDGIFGLALEAPPAPAGLYRVEITATDAEDNLYLWPYLQVSQ